jgi:ribonuclease HI
MPDADRPEVHIYTDGACSPNPGVGGWGAVLISPAHNNFHRELSGAEDFTTNNRMELTAAIMALRALKQPARVYLHTDSQYLRNAFTARWLENWQRNGWKNKDRKDVANKDLWLELLELEKRHDIEWRWVRGHHVDAENARADALAVAAREERAEGLGRS